MPNKVSTRTLYLENRSTFMLLPDGLSTLMILLPDDYLMNENSYYRALPFNKEWGTTKYRGDAALTYDVGVLHHMPWHGNTTINRQLQFFCDTPVRKFLKYCLCTYRSLSPSISASRRKPINALHLTLKGWSKNTSPRYSNLCGAKLGHRARRWKLDSSSSEQKRQSANSMSGQLYSTIVLCLLIWLCPVTSWTRIL